MTEENYFQAFNEQKKEWSLKENNFKRKSSRDRSRKGLNVVSSNLIFNPLTQSHPTICFRRNSVWK